METMDEFFERWDGEDRDALKLWILTQAGDGEHAKRVGQATYIVQGKRVHVRWTQAATGANWPFDINPTTLRADFEVWILGWSLWYVIPMAAIEYMHSAPTAYPNHRARATTIVTVNEDRDECQFASGERKLDISPFRHATLNMLNGRSAA